MKDYDKLFQVLDKVKSRGISIEEAQLIIKNDPELLDLAKSYGKELKSKHSEKYPSRREFKKRFNK